MRDEKDRTQPVWTESIGTDIAPVEFIYVCAACGKTSRSRYGFDSSNARCSAPGWDESCMLHAVLCHAEKAPDGVWQAVQS